MPPRPGAPRNRPDKPSSPSFNNDTEAASQQLLAEASPARRQPAAVQGANLLNAARMLPQSPTMTPPAQVEKPEKAGKLKRAGRFHEEPHQKIRGENVWELGLSPQKSSSLPAQVAAPEKVQELPGTPDEDRLVPETSQAEERSPGPEIGVLAEMPQSDNIPAVNHVQAKERISKNVPVSPIKSRQESASSATRKPRERPPKRKNTGSAVSASVHEENELSALSTATEQMRDPGHEHASTANANKSDKEPRARKKRKLKGWTAREVVAAELEEGMIASAPVVQQDARPRTNSQPLTIPIRSTRLPTAPVEAEKAKCASTIATPSNALDEVFKFANSTGPRLYPTHLGTTIHRMCDRACTTLNQSGEDLSLEVITQCKNGICTLLRDVSSKVEDASRADFKGDAYSFIFRALALVFEAMHNRLWEKLGNVFESIAAIQILQPYVNDMLRLKNTLVGWQVRIPSCRDSEGLVKVVGSNLIVHLRNIEKEFRSQLKRLEKAKQTHQASLDLQRRKEEQEEELMRKEKALSAEKKRRKRWQNLHVMRMQCEPDLARRRRLRFVEPYEVVEKDADGNEFERLSVFGDRTMPPPRWAAATSGTGWTKEQETVLLDAMQSFAGPTVLERTFRMHCHPGGALRDFTVADFAAKMAWVRSGWTRLSQEYGWEIPEWVRKNPVLP